MGNRAEYDGTHVPSRPDTEFPLWLPARGRAVHPFGIQGGYESGSKMSRLVGAETAMR